MVPKAKQHTNVITLKHIAKNQGFSQIFLDFGVSGALGTGYLWKCHEKRPDEATKKNKRAKRSEQFVKRKTRGAPREAQGGISRILETPRVRRSGV